MTKEISGETVVKSAGLVYHNSLVNIEIPEREVLHL